MAMEEISIDGIVYEIDHDDWDIRLYKGDSSLILENGYLNLRHEAIFHHSKPVGDDEMEYDDDLVKEYVSHFLNDYIRENFSKFILTDVL